MKPNWRYYAKAWSKLTDPDRRQVARDAGFSESESALLAKIRWEGFPQYMVNQILTVWHP